LCGFIIHPTFAVWQFGGFVIRPKIWCLTIWWIYHLSESCVWQFGVFYHPPEIWCLTILGIEHQPKNLMFMCVVFKELGFKINSTHEERCVKHFVWRLSWIES
jgi:hypothetical protein